MITTNTGRKDDQNKSRYDLLAPEFLELTSQVLTFGAEKYGERNWESGMKLSRPFAALMRHMWAWWRGEMLDPETKLPHLAHASCCIMFLLTYEQRRIGIDDRKTTIVPPSKVDTNTYYEYHAPLTQKAPIK